MDCYKLDIPDLIVLYTLSLSTLVYCLAIAVDRWLTQLYTLCKFYHRFYNDIWGICSDVCMFYLFLLFVWCCLISSFFYFSQELLRVFFGEWNQPLTFFQRSCCPFLSGSWFVLYNLCVSFLWPSHYNEIFPLYMQIVWVVCSGGKHKTVGQKAKCSRRCGSTEMPSF